MASRLLGCPTIRAVPPDLYGHVGHGRGRLAGRHLGHGRGLAYGAALVLQQGGLGVGSRERGQAQEEIGVEFA